MARGWRGGVVLALCACSVVANAQASEATEIEDAEVADAHDAHDDEAARVHFRAGQVFYEGGRLEDAQREFERAFAASPRPALRYNLYLCARDLGDLAGAREHLRAYLEGADEVENRALLEERLRALDEIESEPETPGEEGADGAGPSTGGVVLLAAGGGAVVAGVVSAVLARAARDDLQEGHCAGSVCAESGRPALARARRRARAADALLFGGGALALGGLLWVLLADGDDEAPVSAQVDRRGVIVRGQVRF